MSANFKPWQGPQDWTRSIFIPIPKKGSAKEYSNHQKLAFISHANKVTLKILQTRFENFQIHMLGLEEAEEPEIKWPTFIGS